MPIDPLPADALYTACDADAFDFETTAELEELDLVLGQGRAADAIRFGIRIGGHGYNIYALGPDGTGKRTAAREILACEAAGRPVPDDWCYVNNFADPRKPRALRLPPGLGRRLAADIDQFVEDLRGAIPAAFRREDFQARKAEIEEELQERQQQALARLREEAKSQHIALLETPTGFAFAPVTEEGEPIHPLRFQQLPEAEQQRIRARVEALEDKLQKAVHQFPRWHKEMRDKLKALHREIAEFAVNNIVSALRERYEQQPAVLAFVDSVRVDVIDNVDAFLAVSEEVSGPPGRADHLLQRYRVNVLVDNGEAEAAPMVEENLPSHGNLIGRTEYLAQMGTLVTDFTLIKPGALHRANGGYLLLDVRKVLQQPFAWEGLKRALLAREIRIESIERTLSLLSTVTLEPEPIPLDVKVVLIGDRLLYYLLAAWDPDFGDLFKVAADFEDDTPRAPDTDRLYARLCATVARRVGAKALDRGAVAAVIERCARIAGDARRSSLHLRSIGDLIQEADYWAGVAGHMQIAREDVHAAIEQQIYRAERLRSRTQEEIERGTLMIDTDGEQIAQVNGLSVIDLGNFSFGQPARITATTRLGEGEIVDIERETELGGSLHSKGVLILSSFLAARYAPGYPLSLAASLVFEQSYGFVEGDSASLAELCALLSSLAGVPIRQSLAVTGSVNQLGGVQAIGAVNEKIEGFFDVCRRRGLNGTHGVLIPASNVQHLMLRAEVIDAARAGRFAIYAVREVDEAMELLTGRTAGVRDRRGRYPPGSVNGLVEDRLIRMSQQRQAFARDKDDR